MKKFDFSLNKLILSTITVITALIVVMQIACIGMFFNMLNEQKNMSVKSVVSQSAQSIEEKISTVSNILNYCANNINVHQFLEEENSKILSSKYIDITNDLSLANLSSDSKITLILVDNEGKFHNFRNTPSENEEKKIRSFFDSCNLKSDTQTTTMFTVDTNLYDELYICCAQPIYKPTKEYVGMKKLGTAIVVSNINIYKILSAMGYSDNTNLTLHNFETDETLAFTKELSSGSTTSYSQKIEGGTWTLDGMMNFKNQTSSIYNIIIIVIIELLIIVIMIFAVQFTILNRFITKPVTEIIKFFDNFALHSTKEQLYVNSPSDFHVLSKHINNMIDNTEKISRKIVYTQQKLYEAELSRQHATMFALQSQINPHFLYNTLECINGIAVSYHATEITHIIDSLSHMLRYAINGDAESYVEEEIHMLSEYLEILKIKFPNRFTVEYDFDDEIWDKKILRMMFQPIVENAFKHGFNQTVENGILEICGHIKNGNMVFEFYDNGTGISPEKLAWLNNEITESGTNLYTNQSVGIANINHRIKLNYGDDYGLRVESEFGKYTRIIVTLPL